MDKPLPRNNKTGRITEMFEENRQFTEACLLENERLRLSVAELTGRIHALEAQQDPTGGELADRLHATEQEKDGLAGELAELKRRYEIIEQENWEFSERYLQVERQNTSLLNLYVASQRLHSTLDFHQVLQIVMELVINLVGSECFEICLHDPETQELVVLAGLGTEAKTGMRLKVDGETAGALETGMACVAEEPGADLVACVPLQFSDQVRGAVLIRALLPQKAGVEGIDHELFDLLGEHAATAMFASHVYTSVGLNERDGFSKQVEKIIQAASDFAPPDAWASVIA